MERVESKPLTRQNPVMQNSRFFFRHNRLYMRFLFISLDLLALTIAGLAAVLIRNIFPGGISNLEKYVSLIPFLALFLFVFAWNGLYNGIGLTSVEELQRVFAAASTCYLLLLAYTSLARQSEIYSRAALGLAWVISIILVMVMRWIFRSIAIRLKVWGEPVAIVGYGEQGSVITSYLKRYPRLGLKPVTILDHFGANGSISPAEGLAVLDVAEAIRNPAALDGIETAIMVSSEIPPAYEDSLIDDNQLNFKRVILIPDLQHVGSMGVLAHDLGGFIGLEVRQNLLSSTQQFVKRVIDVVLVLLIGIVAFPLTFLAALLIKIDSRGPAFYAQVRIGREGKIFKMWKLRTMVLDADKLLDEFLKKNTEIRDEWERDQKIKDDPRITRVGRILRKLSLDELPQLYNILIGDMSLVGPRPFLVEQAGLYGKNIKLYKRVRPGLTGLWQVSGRNATTFSERAALDGHYVRNWSIWLDLYILLRTAWVVLTQDGAF